MRLLQRLARGLVLTCAAWGLTLQAAAELRPGAPAPAFSLTQIDGKKASLSGLKGKVVLLSFWEPG